MRAVLLGNPKSGRGLAGRLRPRFERTLRDGGIETDCVDVDRTIASGVDPRRIDGADALVVFGGDGTIHHVSAIAMETSTPIYHVPAGNENLFAREFGMSRSPSRLLTAMREARVKRIDVPTWNDRNYLIMASTGLDAGVIGRLHSARSWAVGHAAYFEPMLREAFWPTRCTCTVTVDGERVVENERGTVIVANSREYAGRLNLARSAAVDDGMLDYVFIPHLSMLGASRWAVRAWLRVIHRGPGAAVGRGRVIEIETADPGPWQIDGELASSETASCVCRVQPKALPVLIPAVGGRHAAVMA